MSEVTAPTTDSHENGLNGTYGEEPEETTSVDVEGGGVKTHGQGDDDDDEEEESDDYDDNEVDYEEERQIVGDESDDEDEEDGEDSHTQEQGTLTHLLIGNPNAPVDGDEDEDEDDEDDEDEDEDYVEELEEQYEAPAPPVITGNVKKRPIDEVVDEEDDTQGAKKVKA